MVEIKNLLPSLESAFSGVEYAAAALRAEELGFDRSTAFWPTLFPKEITYGMAWSDDPDLVAAPAPDNLDLYRRIAAGEDVGEISDAVTIHPANSKEPNPLLEMLRRKPDEDPG